MADWCDYWNAEWRKRFDGIKSKYYKTKMDGNTLYVIRRRFILVWIFKKMLHIPEPAVCTIPMCKLKESALIDELKEYGFLFGGK